MAEIPDTIQEEREELMVTGIANPTLRIAHFLTPSITEPVKDFPPLPPSSLPAASYDLKNLLQKVEFKGWLRPNESWKMWVLQLHSTHHCTWKKVGIYDAIMSTATNNIVKHTDLILGVAENWCLETNTFIFPWGEATVTLEDMMVLGGYSALGDSVLSPLKTEELKETETALLEAYSEVARKTDQIPRTVTWIDYFIARKGCEFEHEAFLSLWLSRYVFPFSYDKIGKHLFPTAICLARETTVALAPAVLANIYRDLGSLKERIVHSNKVGTGKGEDESMLRLFSPIHLVQLWVWERFPTLRPKPNLIECGEPRLARWDKLKVQVENVRLTIDSDGEFFQWRPYAATVKNWSFHKFYKENEEWVLVDSDLDNELESIARCMRISELVGFDCIQQYLPHRVAMQFGLDQDVPGCVFRSNDTPEIAWSNYNRPIRDAKLYIPPRLYESDVTTRYFNWWTQWMLVLQDAIRGVVRRPRSLSRRGQNVKRHKKAEDSLNEDTLTIKELLQLTDKQHSPENRPVGDVSHLLDNDDRTLHMKSIEKNVHSEAVMDESEEAVEDILRIKELLQLTDKQHSTENRPVCDVEHLLDSDYQTLSSCNMSVVMNKEEELLKKCKEKNVQHEAVVKESEEAMIQRIKELFQLSDKQQSLENQLVGDVGPLLNSDNRTPSTSNMCTVREENQHMTSIEKNVQCEDSVKESEKVVENIKENNPEITVIDGLEGGGEDDGRRLVESSDWVMKDAQLLVGGAECGGGVDIAAVAEGLGLRLKDDFANAGASSSGNTLGSLRNGGGDEIARESADVDRNLCMISAKTVMDDQGDHVSLSCKNVNRHIVGEIANHGDCASVVDTGLIQNAVGSGSLQGVGVSYYSLIQEFFEQLPDKIPVMEGRAGSTNESFLQEDHSVGAHLSLGVPTTELENQLMEVETQAKLDAKQMSKESGSKQSGIKSNGVDLVVEDLNTYVSINGNCDHGNGNQDIVVEEQMTNIEKSNNTGKKKIKPTASKSGFSASDLVWGKIRSYPWWPGQIFDPSDSSKKSMNYFKKDSFLIAYFGDGTFAWNEASRLKPFGAHFSHMEKQSNMETFRHAVDCALDEVASRVEFGLSCPCLSEGLYSNIKSQIVVNSGIQTESRRRDAGDQYSSATSFEPAKLVDYIKALGRCSYGVVDRLEFVIAQAQLLSLYRWRGYPQLPSQSLDNEVSCSHSTVEIPGLELEARISKLEQVIAGLKAAYISKQFYEKKPGREGQSDP